MSWKMKAAAATARSSFGPSFLLLVATRAPLPSISSAKPLMPTQLSDRRLILRLKSICWDLGSATHNASALLDDEGKETHLLILYNKAFNELLEDIPIEFRGIAIPELGCGSVGNFVHLIERRYPVQILELLKIQTEANFSNSDERAGPGCDACAGARDWSILPPLSSPRKCGSDYHT